MKEINVAYYRVSTRKQESSGLGLEAQKALVFGFLRREPDFEFTDIESGGNDYRPSLLEAIEKVKQIGFEGRLVIAKLDRLSRDVHFISGLIKSGINFVCCDNPSATPFTIHILASVAEFERKMIKERTRNAIQAKIEREIKSGNVNYRWGANNNGGGFNPNRKPREGAMTVEEIKQARADSVRKKAMQNPNVLAALGTIMDGMRKGKSLAKIAEGLNDCKFKTPTELGVWDIMKVQRICKYFYIEKKRKKSYREEVEDSLKFEEDGRDLIGCGESGEFGEEECCREE